MSEPNEFPPPPFTPAPLEASERSGCRKALLFGCGSMVLLLLLGLVGMVAKAPEIMRAMLGYLEQDYAAKIAPDVPAADRERLHRAFEAARARPLQGKDPAALQEFQGKVLELGGKSQLNREDVRSLAGSLEKMGGIQPPAEAPAVPNSSSPAPSPPSPPPAPSRAPTPPSSST